MNYITTTELRTKTTGLVEALQGGEEVDILHRSKIVGRIIPKSVSQRPIKTVTDPAKLISGIKRLVGDAGKYTKEERKAIYHKHLESKYGKHFFRR